MPVVKNKLGEGTQSVILTTAILECLADSAEPVSITNIARRIGTSKSRIFRHLQTLVTCDYATWLQDRGVYAVGPALMSLSEIVSHRHDIQNLALPLMNALRDKLGHTVILSTLDSKGMRVLRSVSGTSSIVIEVRQGTLLPFETSAQGLVAMAMASSQQLAAHRDLRKARDEFAATNADTLATVAAHGCAVHGMREGLNGIAAPVFNAGGALVATVAMLDTIAEMGREVPDETMDALKSSARDLSWKLGFDRAETGAAAASSLQ